MLEQKAGSITWLKNKRMLAAILIFCISLLWIVFLVQGLPIGDLDDWALIFISQQVPWNELISNFVTPWSQSDFWFNQSDLFDQIRHKRIFNGIVLKATQDVFGMRFFPFYLTTKAFFFAGTMTLVFLFLTSLTGTLLLPFAGTALFFFVPAYYSHALWIADPITMALFFAVLGFYFFYRFTVALDKEESFRKLVPWIAGMFLAGWFGIKCKEPALIFPATAGAYLLLHFRSWKGRWPAVAAVLFLLVLVMFQLVPIEKPPAQSFTYRLTSITRMLFCNYQVGYDDEPISAFFSLKTLWPVSIARTFGFFSLWGIALFGLVHGAGRIFRRSKTPGFFDHPLARISALWACLEILLMGLFQPEPRYFSGTLIPLTLLSVRLVSCVFDSWQGLQRKVWIGIAIFCWATTVFYFNIQQVISLRTTIGMRSNRLFETARTVFSDLHGEKNAPVETVASFYCAANVLKKPEYPRMEDVVFFAEDLYYERWNKTPDGSLNDFDRFAKTGAVYYITGDSKKFDDYPNAVLISKVSGISRGSLFEFLRYSVKKKKPAPVCIYKKTN